MSLTEIKIPKNSFNCLFNALGSYFMTQLTLTPGCGDKEQAYCEKTKKYLKDQVFFRLLDCPELSFLTQEDVNNLYQSVIVQQKFCRDDKITLLGWILRVYHITLEQDKTLKDAINDIKHLDVDDKSKEQKDDLVSLVESWGPSRQVRSLTATELAKVKDALKRLKDSIEDHFVANKANLKRVLSTIDKSPFLSNVESTKFCYEDSALAHHQPMFHSERYSADEPELTRLMNFYDDNLRQTARGVLQANRIEILKQCLVQFDNTYNLEQQFKLLMDKCQEKTLDTDGASDLDSLCKVLTRGETGDEGGIGYSFDNRMFFMLYLSFLPDNLKQTGTEKEVALYEGFCKKILGVQTLILKEDLTHQSEDYFISSLLLQTYSKEFGGNIRSRVDLNDELKARPERYFGLIDKLQKQIKPLPRFFYNNDSNEISDVNKEAEHFIYYTVKPYSPRPIIRQSVNDIVLENFDDFVGFLKDMCVFGIRFGGGYNYQNRSLMVNRFMQLKIQSQFLKSQQQQDAAGVFEAAFSDAKISMREIFKNQDEKCRVDELNRFKSKIDQYLLNECIKSENSWTQLIHDVCCAVFIVPLFIRRIEENVFGLLKDQSIFARRTYHQTLLDDCVKGASEFTFSKD
ncbi:MAG TPA: hypothetical protein QF353_00350 [Gammaproteobacteria bacterium]|nr:hypothetical protein [Gammaproteobacteria bacterium]